MCHRARLDRISHFAVSALTVALLSSCSSNSRLAVTLATSTPDAGLHDDAVVHVYELARRRDERALVSLGEPVSTPAPSSLPQASEGPIVLEPDPSDASARASSSSSPSPTATPTPTPTAAPGTLTPAIALALFVIDRKRYARDFVSAYPVDPDGVTIDYGTDFARAHVVAAGAAFPIAALGTLALSGDSGAYAKLFRAATVAIGSLEDTYRAQIRRVVHAVPPLETFETLESLSPAEQLASVAILGRCHQRSDELLAFHQRAQPIPAGATAAPQPGAMDFAVRVHLLQSAIAQSASADCRLAQTAVLHPARDRVKLPRVRIRPVPKS